MLEADGVVEYLDRLVNAGPLETRAGIAAQADTGQVNEVLLAADNAVRLPIDRKFLQAGIGNDHGNDRLREISCTRGLVRGD